MKRLLGATAAIALFALPAGSSLAGNPGTHGQPNQTCLEGQATLEPGNAASARGSAFNENGGIAGGVYAGSGANTNTPANQDKAVSQYDVACFQFTASHTPSP